MSETQRTIGEWADKTFGRLTDPMRAGVRANEEMAELLTELSLPHDPDWIGVEVVSEVADVVIVLMRLADSLEIDLQDEIDRKMAINRARKWLPDGTGHGRHVTE